MVYFLFCSQIYEKYFKEIASIPSQQAELNRIKAENQKFKAEMAQGMQK